jgi:hypothetical protein
MHFLGFHVGFHVLRQSGPELAPGEWCHSLNQLTLDSQSPVEQSVAKYDCMTKDGLSLDAKGVVQRKIDFWL